MALAARDHGQCRKNSVTSCVGWVRKVNDTATPKLPPPPPREAQYRSGWCLASQVNTLPSAVTIWSDSSASQVRPYLRATTPMPPPRVSPAMPTVGQEPAGMLTPWAASRS